MLHPCCSMAPSLYSTEGGQQGPKGGSDVGSLAVFLGIERGYKQGKFATQWRESADGTPQSQVQRHPLTEKKLASEHSASSGQRKRGELPRAKESLRARRQRCLKEICISCESTLALLSKFLNEATVFSNCCSCTWRCVECSLRKPFQGSNSLCRSASR